MNQPHKPWLTVAETAERLGRSEPAIRRMIQAGKLPAARATEAKRAPWMVDAVELEHQLADDAEHVAIRQRLAGVVVGRGEEFAERLEQEHPDVRVGSADGPTLADYLRQRGAAHDLLERVAVEMRDDSALRQRFEQLDEDQREEEEAQELARRIRRAERIQRRAREILDDDE